MSNERQPLTNTTLVRQVMFSTFKEKGSMIGIIISFISAPLLSWWFLIVTVVLSFYLLWHGFNEWKEKSELIDARFSEFVNELWYDRQIIDFIPNELNQIEVKSVSELKEKPEIAAIPLSERPNILTALVFDSVKSQKVDFHIEIKNIGKVQARNIRVGFNTDEFSDIEITPYISRTLSPGGKLSIAKPIPRVLKPNKTTSLIVKIFYNAEISGIEKMFLQKVRFLVRPSDIKIQTIFPEALEETEVDSGLSEPDLTPTLIQFSQSLGTLCIVLPEVGKNGNPNMIFLGNEFRSFNFDSIARIVSLRAKTIAGGLVSLDLPLLPSKNGIHIIIITWDYAKGATLLIDGKEKGDMRENAK